MGDLSFAVSAYGNAPQKIESSVLIKETPTLKFYRDGQIITIAVRGTRDWRDWISNASLASQSKLPFQMSPRVTKDIADIKDFQHHFPPSEFHYRGIGHSLGGAIVDELIHQNLISEGKSYNPAVHRTDLHAHPKTARVYNEMDPLYRIGTLAGLSQHNTDVRKSTPLPHHMTPLSEIQYHHEISNPALKGGASSSTASTSDPESYAYSDADIRAALGSIPIHKYPELKGMASPDALFKGHNAVILLFLTEGKNEGHWIAVLDHGTHYEVFDSFGTVVDGDRKWLDKEKLMEFGETLPLLSNLLGKGNKPTDHNTDKLQRDKSNTCGRWVVWRVKNAHTPLKAFVAEMKHGPGTPDQKVVECTFSLLNK
jgi:hypothetical protein